ncbi:hypothetical protein NFI96_029121, partial [Prochilodus magdalenae]
DTSVKLNCSYSNTNPKTVFWFSSKQKAKWRNEEHPEDLALDIDYSGRVNTESTNSSSILTLSDLRVEDSGEYHLMMVTQQGEKVLSSSAVNLKVTDLQVKEGLQAGSKALTCSTSCSLPRQRYYWYRNGKYTEKYTDHSNPYILHSGDKGSYSCSAHGYNSILFRPLCVSGSICWNVTYADRRVCVLEGSSVEFPCTYTYPGNPKVTSVFWYYHQQGKDPEDLSVDGQFAGRVEFIGDKERTCTLRMRDVRKTDSREYFFRIITETEKERFSGKPGVILNVTDLQVRVIPSDGETVTLICSSTCTLSNNPTYLWYKDGQPVTNRRTRDNKLDLKCGEDAGSYFCAVRGHEELHSPNQTFSKTCSEVLENPMDKIVGAIVGVSLFVVLILILAAVCLWRRKSRPAKDQGSMVQSTPFPYILGCQFISKNSRNNCTVILYCTWGMERYCTLLVLHIMLHKKLYFLYVCVSVMDASLANILLSPPPALGLRGFPGQSRRSLTACLDSSCLPSRCCCPSRPLRKRWQMPPLYRRRSSGVLPALQMSSKKVQYRSSNSSSSIGIIVVEFSNSSSSNVVIVVVVMHACLKGLNCVTEEATSDSGDTGVLVPPIANSIKSVKHSLGLADLGSRGVSVGVSCVPQAICALRESEVELNCSYPNVNVKAAVWLSPNWRSKWRHEEHPEDLTFDSDYIGRANVKATHSSSTLTIRDLRARDSGRYQLMIITEGGQKLLSSTPVYLTVTGVSEKGCWSVTYTNRRICALVGSSVDFQCVYSYPSKGAVAFWSHNYQRNSEAGNGTAFAGRVEYIGDSKRNCTLRMRDLRMGDSGEYRFTFNTTFAAGELSGQPGVFLSVTDLQVRVIPNTVLDGQTVTLICSSRCTLPNSPSYMWYKDGQPVANRPTKDNKLYLRCGEDAGSYSCAVRGHEELRSPDRTLNGKCPEESSVGVVVFLALILSTAALCMCCVIRRKRGAQRDTGVQTPNPADLTYTALNPTTMSSDYDTLHHLTDPPSDTYTALNPATMCSEYDSKSALPSCLPVSMHYVAKAFLSSFFTFLNEENTEQEWCAGQGCKEKATALQKDIATRLQCAKDHMDKQEGYWNNGVDESCWNVAYTERELCALEGSSVDFHCTYAPPSNQTVTGVFWYYEQLKDLFHEAQFAGRVEFIGDRERNCTLRMRGVRKTDSGEYGFQFSTNADKGRFSGTSGVLLNVAGLQVKVIPSTLLDGQSITLICSSTCVLPNNHTYLWYKNGEPVTSNCTRDNKLYLNSPSTEDIHQYSCAVGGNGMGSIFSDHIY